MSRRPKRSHLIAIISDIHFDLHCPNLWAAFRAWHTQWKPKHTVVLGDFVDLGMLSRYIQGASEPMKAIPQIQMFVREANALAQEAGMLTVVEGNHDERWARLFEGKGAALVGALGLTLEAQCRAQGLDERVKWFIESAKNPVLRLGGVDARHGHNQSGRFGSGMHVAATALRKRRGGSIVFGHTHRGQVYCHTSNGVTDFAVANPCMTIDHNYQPDPDWQKGFTIMECWDSPKGVKVTPHLIISNDGAFAWGGEVFDGKAILAEKQKKRIRDRKRRAR